MKKFSDYANEPKKEESKPKNGGQRIEDNESAFDLLKRVASKYEGANQKDLLTAIMQEAKQAKKRGTLSDEEISNFVSSISPMLNPTQRKQLQSVIKEIKEV